MQANIALSQLIRERVMQDSKLKDEANFLIKPKLNSANIVFQLAKDLSDALPAGPILMGLAKPTHILTPSTTARGVVNMTEIAVAEAQALARSQ